MADKKKRSWAEFKNEMKAKRLKTTGSDANKTGKHKILERKELVVQRLTSEVSGKAQKYTRVGPREFVTYQDEELTIEGIKEACEKHFALDGVVCDILASDQGPSFTSMEHIPDLKVIHVRFIKQSARKLQVGHNGNDSAIEVLSVPAAKLVHGRERQGNNKAHSSTGSPAKCFPTSLSVSQMIKLGKILKPDAATSVLEVYSFDLSTMTWGLIPQKVEFTIEDNVLGSSGFRKAYKARSTASGFNHTIWVVKRCLEKVSQEIQGDLGLSIEEHTKKIVQMHALAKNIASQLTKKVNEKEITTEFGDTLQFNDVFFAKLNSEFVTLEEFIEGDFVKHVNNTGKPCVLDDNMIGQKAQCLSHFSYEKSNGELMLVDLQGSGHVLYDPEIASTELMKDREFLF